MAQCEKCGREHVIVRSGKTSTGCAGHRSSGEKAGQPCGNPPRKGQRVCNYHGAKAAQNVAAAERRTAEAEVIATARKLIPDAEDLTPITNPLERLLQLAAEGDAFRESLRILANKLQDEIRYRGVGAGAEQLRAEVATYQAAFKDVTSLLVAIARLDIEKTLARIEARKVDAVINALSAGADEAGLTEEQKRAVLRHAGRHLRPLAG